MKNSCLLKLFSVFSIIAALFLPSLSDALTITYIDPSYNAQNFTNLNISTNSLEFDSAGNIYAVNDVNNYSGTAVIERLDASTGYTTSSVYATYAAIISVTGLVFDGLGNLYSSGSDIGGNSGVIYKTDLSTMTTSLYYTLSDFRPTGIGADSSGNVYFTGRLISDPFFGNIYKLDSSMSLSTLVPGFVGRGIDVDSSGNIFASNWSDDSIYRFDAATLTPTIIATFDKTPAELTFDESGNLYAFENYIQLGTTEIIRLSQVPEPSTLLLLGSGLAGLAVLRKRVKVRGS